MMMSNAPINEYLGIMELQLLEKSPHIASLLVKLYDTQKMHGADLQQPENRREIASVMASLLEHQLSEREQELVADVLITLVRRAENDMRRALAERLSMMNQVPLRLVLHLCNDQIEIARPILQDSPVLSDLDLAYIIRSQGPEYWRAIAARQGLSVDIADLLAATREDGTAMALLENETANLSAYALEIFTAMAEQSESMAGLLLKRSEMLPELARRLHRYVGQELRNYIQAFYGSAPTEIVKAADDLFLEFIERDDETLVEAVNDAVAQVVEKESSKGQARHFYNLTDAMLLLKSGKVDDFVTRFTECVGLPGDRIKDAFAQPGGRKLAIICRAMRMPKSDFSTIYLHTHRLRSDDRMVNHNDLMKALAYYDGIKPEAAEMIFTRI